MKRVARRSGSGATSKKVAGRAANTRQTDLTAALLSDTLMQNSMRLIGTRL